MRSSQLKLRNSVKQHITKEQWDELSDEEKVKFLDAVTHDEDEWRTMHSGHIIPSIGQMIEFLGDEQYPANRSGKTWMAGWWEELFYADLVDCGCDQMHDVKLGKHYEGELADALWEAVKHKLQK